MATIIERVLEHVAAGHDALRRGDLGEARVRESLAFEEAHKLGRASDAYARALSFRGERLFEEKSFAQAEQALREAIDVRTKAGLRDVPLSRAHYHLGRVHAGEGRWREALASYDAAEAIARDGGPDGSSLLVSYAYARGLVHLKLGADGEAKAALQEARFRAGQRGDEGRGMLAIILRDLLAVLRRRGDTEEAQTVEHELRALEPGTEAAEPTRTDGVEPTEDAPAAPPERVFTRLENGKIDLGEPEELSEALEELEGLVGLAAVKEQVKRMADFLLVQQARVFEGMTPAAVSHHLVFTGSPGTGKTTVARLMAKIYHSLGVIKTDKLVEASRADLVAGYVGQTAQKVNEVVDRALDGVLLVDEAYSLMQEGRSDFGQEAVSTLLQRMENDRHRLVVIVAGYSDKMEEFLRGNPGLRSRFPERIHFADYTPEELFAIFCKMAADNDYELPKRTERRVRELMAQLHANKGESFGNARTVRNIFEDSIAAQASRLAAKKGGIAPKELARLEPRDIVVEAE